MACNPACTTQHHNEPTAVCFFQKWAWSWWWCMQTLIVCYVKALKRCGSSGIIKHTTDCAFNPVGLEKTQQSFSWAFWKFYKKVENVSSESYSDPIENLLIHVLKYVKSTIPEYLKKKQAMIHFKKNYTQDFWSEINLKESSEEIKCNSKNNGYTNNEDKKHTRFSKAHKKFIFF